MPTSVSKNKSQSGVSHTENGTPNPPENSDIGGSDDEAKRSPSDEIDALRKLIVQSGQVSDVLASAFTQSSQKDDQLAKATMPLIEENIRQSVSRNPKVLAEALSPAFGPAIRRSISQSLSSMVQSFNQTLEYSVSPRGLSWRWEAFRTGKSFGEIVMLKTLLFRVEQIFLIHKKTGLLLQHVVADGKNTQDADMVSAMLTAIEDFIEDSFTTPDGATLDSLKMKGFTVWIEHSREALVAGVIRGNPPQELRETFSEAIEEIQLKFEDELSGFDGDPEVFEGTRPLLKRCLQSQANERAKKKKGLLKPMNLFATGFVILAIILTVYFGWQYWRWSGYVEKLSTEPGIVVAESDFGIFTHSVNGLRDPLARKTSDIQDEFGFDENDISENWRLYNDGDAEFVVPRAERLLKPPEGVKLTLNDGILAANGNAPTSWFSEAEKLAPALVGVSGFKIAESAEVLREKIESHNLFFNCNTIDYSESGEKVFTDLVREMEELVDKELKLNIEIRGHATEPGSFGTNDAISKKRAEKVYDEVFSRSQKLTKYQKQDPGAITIVALGESQRDIDCKVSFKVIFK